MKNTYKPANTPANHCANFTCNKCLGIWPVKKQGKLAGYNINKDHEGQACNKDKCSYWLMINV